MDVRRVMGVTALTAMLTMGAGAAVSAAPPQDYIPPNPPPVSVALGEFGVFPLPGLLMADPVEIQVDCPLESGDPVVSPPGVHGESDSNISVAIKNSNGPQVATCEITLTGSQSTAHFTLVLYDGLPLPTTTTTAVVVVTPLPSTGRDVSFSGAAALALVALGGGLVVITRRRVRPEL